MDVEAAGVEGTGVGGAGVGAAQPGEVVGAVTVDILIYLHWRIW